MISDDDLLLYHYRDGLEAAERTRIGAALSAQPALAQRLQGLVTRLDAAAALPEVPVPLEVQQRWRAALERAAHADGVSKGAHTPRVSRLSYLRWPAAAAAVAIVALVLIVPKQSTKIAAPVTAQTATGTVDPSAYERGLKFHLASTEQRLAGLNSATPEDRARLVATIIEQNRMYALAAERASEPQLARVLRAFAPVLESVAQDGGDSSGSIARLSFELRVMQGRLSADAAPSSTPSTSL